MAFWARFPRVGHGLETRRIALLEVGEKSVFIIYFLRSHVLHLCFVGVFCYLWRCKCTCSYYANSLIDLTWFSRPWKDCCGFTMRNSLKILIPFQWIFASVSFKLKLEYSEILGGGRVDLCLITDCMGIWEGMFYATISLSNFLMEFLLCLAAYRKIFIMMNILWVLQVM